MSVDLLRTRQCWYVVRGGEAFAVKGDFDSTAALITTGLNAVRTAIERPVGPTPEADLTVLSPVTTPCRVLAQAVDFQPVGEQQVPIAASAHQIVNVNLVLTTLRRATAVVIKGCIVA